MDRFPYYLYENVKSGAVSSEQHKFDIRILVSQDILSKLRCFKFFLKFLG